jgi:hypothetical protein
LVPKKGLEPPHPCEYVDLNHARLPIPPLRHMRLLKRDPPSGQQLLSLAKALCGVKFCRRSNALHPGVFTPFFNIARAFSTRRCRVSSFFASSIHFTYSLRCV